MDYAKNLTWVENLRIQSYSEHPEVKAAADVLVSEFYKGKKQKRKGDPVLGKASMQSARAYLDSFKRHHPLMSPAICSGMGVRLE